MPFVFPKIFDHGSSNPIVARLFMQTLEILKHCNISEDTKQRVVELYRGSLMGKLLFCWEIKERLQSQLSAAMASTPTAVNFPYILRLEEECHNFLYETKNYIRDLLKVFNLLYGTNFKEASEFPARRRAASRLSNLPLSHLAQTIREQNSLKGPSIAWSTSSIFAMLWNIREDIRASW
jgi:hypothetical protein